MKELTGFKALGLSALLVGTVGLSSVLVMENCNDNEERNISIHDTGYKMNRGKKVIVEGIPFQVKDHGFILQDGTTNQVYVNGNSWVYSDKSWSGDYTTAKSALDKASTNSGRIMVQGFILEDKSIDGRHIKSEGRNFNIFERTSDNSKYWNRQ